MSCIHFHRLKYLNLDNNEIFTIPHLKLLGTSPLKPAKSTEQMMYTSSSLDGTPALTHSSSTLPVSREERNLVFGTKGDDKTEDTVGDANIIIDEKVSTDVKDTSTEQGKTDNCNDTQPTKSEPCLFSLTTAEVEEKNTGRDGEAVPTVPEQLSKSPLHSNVSQVKSEPSLLHQSAKTYSNIEAKDTSGDIKESETLPKCLHSEMSADAAGHTNATPPLHAITTPPVQTDQSACTSPKNDVRKEGRVGDFKPISGEDEKSEELAPFPKLETLSLVNNLVCSKSLC